MFAKHPNEQNQFSWTLLKLDWSGLITVGEIHLVDTGSKSSEREWERGSFSLRYVFPTKSAPKSRPPVMFHGAKRFQLGSQVTSAGNSEPRSSFCQWFNPLPCTRSLRVVSRCFQSIWHSLLRSSPLHLFAKPKAFGVAGYFNLENSMWSQRNSITGAKRSELVRPPESFPYCEGYKLSQKQGWNKPGISRIWTEKKSVIRQKYCKGVPCQLLVIFNFLRWYVVYSILLIFVLIFSWPS